MTAAFFLYLLFLTVLLFLVLITGSPLFVSLLTGGVMALLIDIAGYLTLKKGFRSRLLREKSTVRQGDEIRFRAEVAFRSPLPAGECTVRLREKDGSECPIRLAGSDETFGGDRPAMLSAEPAGRGVSFSFGRRSVHTGPETLPEISFRLTDFLRFFHTDVHPRHSREKGTVLVLPVPRPCAPLAFGGESSTAAAAPRATENTADPSDVRAFRPGDPMTRIHWKLSLRQRELLVRRYEQQSRQESLILTDPSLPHCPADPEAAQCIRDLLRTEAASVIAAEKEQGRSFRVAFQAGGKTLTERTPLQDLLCAAAAAPFDSREPLAEHVLRQLRLARQAGAVVLITTRISGDVARILLRCCRMGQKVSVRFCSVTPEGQQPPDIGENEVLLKLRAAGADVLMRDIPFMPDPPFEEVLLYGT